MMELKDKIIKVAEENGWSVYIEDETEDYICFDFGKYSPAGQDFPRIGRIRGYGNWNTYG